jgi:hypothetical protein
VDLSFSTLLTTSLLVFSSCFAQSTCAYTQTQFSRLHGTARTCQYTP